MLLWPPLTGTSLSPVGPRSWVLPSGYTPGNRHDRWAKPGAVCASTPDMYDSRTFHLPPLKKSYGGGDSNPSFVRYWVASHNALITSDAAPTMRGFACCSTNHNHPDRPTNFEATPDMPSQRTLAGLLPRGLKYASRPATNLLSPIMQHVFDLNLQISRLFDSPIVQVKQTAMGEGGDQYRLYVVHVTT
ncbi:unnamed protein product [Schistocephalus solidus]|uniref:Uncharacterized protein n=1 Tax=Schistocephalus solidus TaxID=70667 RepID=A0A183T1K9_SCHSO|nr:unnamed protein product [Schistocephalus solidus]